MKRLAIPCLALSALITTAPTIVAAPVDGPSAFERLKDLGGTWRGGASGEGLEAEGEAAATTTTTHEFRLSAAGTVVMEIMAPGSEHEMINMYHLDGDELVLTHYCAGGSQPTMKLDPEASSDDRLVFTFTGGTNLDDSQEQIRGAEITFRGDDAIDSAWKGYRGEERLGILRFHLERVDD